MQENNTISKDFTEFKEITTRALLYKQKIDALHKRIRSNNTHVHKSIRLLKIDLLHLKKLKMMYKQKKKDMLETIIQYLYTELQEKGEQYMQIRLLIEKIQLEIENLECLNNTYYDTNMNNKNIKENDAMYQDYSNYTKQFAKAKNSVLYDLEILLEILEQSRLNKANKIENNKTANKVSKLSKHKKQIDYEATLFE